MSSPLLALRASVQAARQQCDRDLGAAQEVARAGLRAEQQVVQLTAELEQFDRVTRLLTSVGEAAQQAAQHQIEELVTRGLQVIFGNELSFHVVQTVKANASHVEFVIRSQYADRAVDTPVLEARGGGMAVVVAFMLRLVVLLLTPGTRKILFLDESFSHVSKEYEPRLAEFLREVTEKADVQIVLVTHSDAYGDLADRRYQLIASGGITTVQGQAEEADAAK